MRRPPPNGWHPANVVDRWYFYWGSSGAKYRAVRTPLFFQLFIENIGSITIVQHVPKLI